MQTYKTPLCGCCGDLSICIYGLFCPCCLNAANLAALRSESCGICHCYFNFSPFWIRQMIKSQNNIREDRCDDCLIFLCCCCCAICQDARELKSVI